MRLRLLNQELKRYNKKMKGPFVSEAERRKQDSEEEKTNKFNE
jgi:hypothetical protein